LVVILGRNPLWSSNAPDNVLDTAGHAPTIADETYAEYLRRIGEYGAKAMPSRKDCAPYEAIRHLSIVKETPGAGAGEVRTCLESTAGARLDLAKPIHDGVRPLG
jgi:phenylalanine-4-hydroxylase